MQNRNIEKYFFLGFLLLVTLFVIILFRPFFAVLVVGASLAVVLHPLYTWFNQKITRGHNWIAALLSVILFVVVLCGPVLLAGIIIFTQAQDLYQSVTHGGVGPFLQSIGTSINSVLPPELTFNIQDKITELAAFLSSHLATVFTATLDTLFSLLLVILIIFYFLKDGDSWKRSLVLMSPLADTDDEKILSKLAHAINGVIKGYVIIGLAQGTLMGVGLALFGVPTPALWAVVAAFASLVPTVGTAVVAVPAIAYLLAVGAMPQAIGMTVWAILIVGMVDNLLNPLVIGSRVDIPPLLILFSVLGGIALLGPVGVLVGPLAVSLLYSLVGIYRTSFQGTQS